ncbi:MAG: hypothetical protein H7329_03325 [Opitutaceae bacterium]|nr:hypothetical protein [Cytophagales bacterium]
MKQAFVFLLSIFLPLVSFTRHPIESLSVGDLTFQERSINIKVKCLEEGLRSSLNNFTHKNIIFDYDEEVFNNELLRIIESYFKMHLLLTVNNKRLTLKLKKAYWVKGTQSSDHAMINMEVSFLSSNTSQIHYIEIKNTLFMSVSEQINILNTPLLNGENRTLIFKKGNETVKINCNN